MFCTIISKDREAVFLFGLYITPLLIHQSASRNGIEQKQFPLNEWERLHDILLGRKQQWTQSTEMNISVWDFLQDYAMKAVGFYAPHHDIYTFLWTFFFFKPIRPSYHIYLHIFGQNSSLNILYTQMYSYNIIKSDIYAIYLSIQSS